MSVTSSVRDHFTPLAEYPHVRENVTLRDVFAELKAKYDSADNFRSVLVLDAENRLLGTLGVHDLLHALLPDYLQQTPTRYEGDPGDISSLATLWQEDCRENCRKAAAGPIAAHVRPVRAVLAPDDPLAKAFYLFATKPVKVLAVIEGHRVIGVLRRYDVVNEVLKAVLGQGEAS
jgi:CBS domain-containing protein